MPEVHRPVLMSRPPAAVADRIEALQRGVGGDRLDRLKPVRKHMLHSTALAFNLTPVWNIEPLLGRICQVVPTIELESFNLSFNKLGSFERWGGLDGTGAGIREAADRRRKLIRAMKAAGLGLEIVDSSSRPHVTLFHNAPPFGAHEVDPIGWPVRELLLIRSHHGSTFHEEIARWPLAPPRQGELFPLD